MATKKYLDDVGLAELVKKSKETFVTAVLDGETDGAKAKIQNYSSGGLIGYTPSAGKAGSVSVDSGSNSAAGAKVMMRVRDVATADGHILYGNDSGFFYHKGTSIAPDELDEILTKRDIPEINAQAIPHINGVEINEDTTFADLKASYNDLIDLPDLSDIGGGGGGGGSSLGKLTAEERTDLFENHIKPFLPQFTS